MGGGTVGRGLHGMGFRCHAVSSREFPWLLGQGEKERPWAALGAVWEGDRSETEADLVKDGQPALGAPGHPPGRAPTVASVLVEKLCCRDHRLPSACSRQPHGGMSARP